MNTALEGALFAVESFMPTLLKAIAIIGIVAILILIIVVIFKRK